MSSILQKYPDLAKVNRLGILHKPNENLLYMQTSPISNHFTTIEGGDLDNGISILILPEYTSGHSGYFLRKVNNGLSIEKEGKTWIHFAHLAEFNCFYDTYKRIPEANRNSVFPHDSYDYVREPASLQLESKESKESKESGPEMVVMTARRAVEWEQRFQLMQQEIKRLRSNNVHLGALNCELQQQLLFSTPSHASHEASQASFMDIANNVCNNKPKMNIIVAIILCLCGIVILVVANISFATSREEGNMTSQ